MGIISETRKHVWMTQTMMVSTGIFVRVGISLGRTFLFDISICITAKMWSDFFVYSLSLF